MRAPLLGREYGVNPGELGTSEGVSREQGGCAVGQGLLGDGWGVCASTAGRVGQGPAYKQHGCEGCEGPKSERTRWVYDTIERVTASR